MESIESFGRERGIGKLNTGKSLHSDNQEMIRFCETMGFSKNAIEIHCFTELLKTQQKRIERFETMDFEPFLPPNNKLVFFTENYFDAVYEMALEFFKDMPFYSEKLIYQALLTASENHSVILVEDGCVNGMAIYSSTKSKLHLHFIAIKKEYRQFGMPVFIIGPGLCRGFREGKTSYTFNVYHDDEMFSDISQVLQKPVFVIAQMEKIIS